MRLVLLSLLVTHILADADTGEHPKLYYATQKGVKNRFLVVFKDTEDDPSTMTDRMMEQDDDLSVDTEYSSALQGFAMDMTDGTEDDTELAWKRRMYAKMLYILEDEGVDFIEQDSPVWGLDRIDQATPFLDGRYQYETTGSTVTVYVLDTGIRGSHEEFGGRVTCGFSSIRGEGPCDDRNGHGTHVAGTLGSTTYGVAKETNLVAVKVLGNDGSGSNAGVLAGIDYVSRTAQGRRAVANMSLGGGISRAIDRAVERSIDQGIFYAVAAGNEDQDACFSSPARSNAMAVGATSVFDARASFSNFGTCVDMWGPGVHIESLWWRSDSDTNIISGTSMASPHVAGVAVLYMERHPEASAAEIKQLMINDAVRDALSGLRFGSPNVLVTTSQDGDASAPTTPGTARDEQPMLDEDQPTVGEPRDPEAADIPSFPVDDTVDEESSAAYLLMGLAALVTALI